MHYKELIKEAEGFQEILNIGQNKDWAEGEYEKFFNVNENKYEDMKAFIEYLDGEVF